MLLPFLLGSALAAPLTLDEAVARATSDSPDARAVDARADDARAAAWQARAPLLPQVVAQLQYQHWNEQIEFPNPFDATADPIILQKQETVNATVSGSQVIFSGAGFGRAAGAGAAGTAAEAGAEASQAGLAVSAAQAWINARATADVAAAAHEALARAEDHLKAAEASFAADTITALAVDRARLAVQDAQRRAIDADRVAGDALGQLGVTLGEVPSDGLAPLPEPAPPRQVDDSALENRAEVRAADAQVRAARAQTWTVVGDWVPTLAANGMWRATNNPGFTGETTQWYVGATATLPILDGGTRFADASRATAARVQAEANADRARLVARQELDAAQRGAEAARASLEVARSQVEIARRAREATEIAFQAGAATQLEVDDAQQQELEAQVGAIRAQGAAILAEWQIKRALGEI